MQAEYDADKKEIPKKAEAAAAVQVAKVIEQVAPQIGVPVVKKDGEVVAGRAAAASSLMVGLISLLVLVAVF